MPDLTFFHPMVVHFPIALLIAGFFSDLAGILLKKEYLSKAGLLMLLAGALGAVVAYFSGSSAGEGLAEGGALKQALEAHEGAAELTLWLVLVGAVLRGGFVLAKKYSGALRWIPTVVLLAAVLSIARTGHLGGQLVFKHAAGVQLSFDTFPADSTQEAMPEQTGSDSAQPEPSDKE